VVTVSENVSYEPAKVIDFKPAAPPETVSEPPKKESGEQISESAKEKRSKRIGVLNLNQLDALEF
jgi:hypothetical protein